MLQKWGIYARVSTEREEQKTSVPNQTQYCTKWIVENGFAVYDVYVDDGISGKSLLIRPDVQRLLADAEAGKIDGVIFNNISRFGRDNLDLLYMKRKIVDELGLRMVSLEQGWDSAKDPDELLFIIHAGMSQYQRKNLSRQIKHSCMEKAKRGEYPLPVPPLGYTRPRKVTREDGNTVRPESYKLQVDPKTSWIIQGIFELASKGIGSFSIAEKLNKGMDGEHPFPVSVTPLKGAKRWYVDRVLDILRNPVYIGNIIFNKGTGSGGHKANAQSEWVIYENAHEPLVSKELFYRIQDMLSRRSTNRDLTTVRALLVGLARCDVCGNSMRYDKRMAIGSRKHKTYNQYEYYLCQHLRLEYNVKRPKSLSIPARILERLVMERIEKAYLDSAVIDGILVEKKKLLDVAIDNSETEIKKLEKELAKIDRSFRKDLELFRSEAISIDTFKALQQENENEKQNILKRIAQLQQAAVLQESMESRVQYVKAKLANFGNIDKADHAQLKMFLSDVIEKVVVKSPTSIEIYYRGLHSPLI